LLLQHLVQPVLLAKGKTVIVYIIGTLSTFWFIERMSTF